MKKWVVVLTLIFASQNGLECFYNSKPEDMEPLACRDAGSNDDFQVFQQRFVFDGLNTHGNLSRSKD